MFNHRVVREVSTFEKMLGECSGRPVGDELPQAATQDDIATDLICESTGKSHSFIHATWHQKDKEFYQ